MSRRPEEARIEARLRRLRVTLTLLFTATLAAGLVILAVIAVRTDTESRRDSLDAEMRRRAEASSRLLYYSARGLLRLDGVRDDDVTVGKPEILVMLERGDGGFTEVFRGPGPHLPLRRAEVDELSRRSVETETTRLMDGEDRSGDPVRLLATPFYDDNTGEAAGAVVSATSMLEAEEVHQDLVLSMTLGCLGLIVLAAGAGWLLAGRSLRPAARGLAQQEALLADAAHELRNPTASITAVLEAAEIDPRSREQAVRTALEASRRMGETVDALLTRARREAGGESLERVPLRLDQLVRDLAAELGGEEGRVEVGGGEVVVSADPVLLRVAVRNLIDNALRHGRRAGEAAAVEVAVEPGAVRVLDRGPGPPAGAGEGFHRYRRGAPGGTGLGLSIAAWVAEAHGGELALEAREGGGTEARLRLSRDR